MIFTKHGDITIRSLTRRDAPLLVKWLSDPRVLAYYEGRDRPHDMALVMKHFYNGEEVGRAIIQYQGRAIGYMQFYLIGDEEIEEYGFRDFSGKIYGMDQFIGEIDYWNRGIGTRVIEIMVQYLFQHLGADMIVMDPQARNARALRVYEKCGFRKIKLLPEHEWHEGEYRDCWLIACEKDREGME